MKDQISDTGDGGSLHTFERERSPPPPRCIATCALLERPALLSRLPADVLARIGSLVDRDSAMCWRLACRALSKTLRAPTRTPRSAMLRSRALAAWAWALPGFRSAAFAAREQAALAV